MFRKGQKGCSQRKKSTLPINKWTYWNLTLRNAEIKTREYHFKNVKYVITYSWKVVEVNLLSHIFAEGNVKYYSYLEFNQETSTRKNSQELDQWHSGYVRVLGFGSPAFTSLDRSCVLNAQAIPPHSPTSKYIHLSRYSKDITLLYPSKGKNMNKKRFSPLGVHYLEEGGESYKQWHLNLFGQILFWDSYENHKLSSEKFTEANSCKTRLNAWATASESLEYLSSWLLATKGFH